MKLSALISSFALLALPFAAFAIQPSVGDISDSRSTGQFFKRLELELKLIGDEMDDVAAVRVKVDKAVDDTGRDILDPEKAKPEFAEYGKYGSGVKMEFKNPSRKAATIKELTGTLELFMPKNDPAAVIAIPNFQAQGGKPIANAALKAAGIEMTIMNAAQYQEAQKKKEEEAKKAAQAQGLPGEMMDSFGDLFAGGFGGNEPNSLYMKLTDPSGKLVAYEIEAGGQKIDSNGSMTSGDLKTLYFSQPVPADATIKLKIATQKALMAMPINFQNIALP